MADPGSLGYQIQGGFFGGVFGDHGFVHAIQYVQFRVPVPHLLGGELFGLRASGVPADGFGEADVEVEEVGRPGVAA